MQTPTNGPNQNPLHQHSSAADLGDGAVELA